MAVHDYFFKSNKFKQQNVHPKDISTEKRLCKLCKWMISISVNIVLSCCYSLFLPFLMYRIGLFKYIMGSRDLYLTKHVATYTGRLFIERDNLWLDNNTGYCIIWCLTLQDDPRMYFIDSISIGLYLLFISIAFVCSLQILPYVYPILISYKNRPIYFFPKI